MMNLSKDDHWRLDYLKSRVAEWNDVRDGAIRAIKKIETKADLKDWADYFLPPQRKLQLQRALAEHKARQASVSKMNCPKNERKITVSLTEEAVQRLTAEAHARKLTPSQLIIEVLSASGVEQHQESSRARLTSGKRSISGRANR